MGGGIVNLLSTGNSVQLYGGFIMFMNTQAPDSFGSGMLCMANQEKVEGILLNLLLPLFLQVRKPIQNNSVLN